MGTFPGNLDQALADWLAGRGQGLAERSVALSRAYGAGATSAVIDPAAYLTARLPATFAACKAVMAEAAAHLVPTSFLDVGAGPGTASWAALAQWPSLSGITQVEQEASFAKLAAALNAASSLPLLQIARSLHLPLQQLAEAEQADLVAASYVLAELPLAAMPATIVSLWRRATQALVLIEPGTPQGFARIRAARGILVSEAAHIAAPCTHANACPMAGDDWCHFKVRLPRSRLHMHAKTARVPFEDEPFCYLVALRKESAVAGQRILAPPHVSKAGVTLKLCGADGLETRHIPSRNKGTFKAARKMRWGDKL
jgi:ribosomal protein RSM22 (predicted rRNA methylase)